LEITAESRWWYGLICLFGQQDIDWEYFETDKDWWAVRFIALNIQN